MIWDWRTPPTPGPHRVFDALTGQQLPWLLVYYDSETQRFCRQLSPNSGDVVNAVIAEGLRADGSKTRAFVDLERNQVLVTWGVHKLDLRPMIIPGTTLDLRRALA